ncbi:uncharacterized protein N7496_007468 [Penicillium cataractarum]|uniref:Uncharacterized protein n=1 Tax=Penicillium cataractarum TaxID=2100454 RepID=A0A9W9S3M0_9EURO|nr:uncharacterized protein N7496_007468 [Penicillium cataractarum]KAJ5371376.1 hypothetical protein N7496_007468 [Penicillium cataractarum]
MFKWILSNASSLLLKNARAWEISVFGVVARKNRIIEHAQARLKAIEAGDGMFSDDEPFVIPGGLYIGFNDLFITTDARTLH